MSWQIIVVTASKKARKTAMYQITPNDHNVSLKLMMRLEFARLRQRSSSLARAAPPAIFSLFRGDAGSLEQFTSAPACY